jgi:hypothetical protein
MSFGQNFHFDSRPKEVYTSLPLLEPLKARSSLPWKPITARTLQRRQFPIHRPFMNLRRSTLLPGVRRIEKHTSRTAYLWRYQEFDDLAADSQSINGVIATLIATKRRL